MNNIIMTDQEERNVDLYIEYYKNLNNDAKYNAEKEFDYIINKVCQKHMFERLLKETLEELNKTNPAVEPGKYHMLCLYSNRYDTFIKRINNSIIRYELKQLKKLKQQHPYSVWYWNLKTMTFYIIKNIKDYYNPENPRVEIEKNVNDKKRD